ncbi:MAG: PQQ-binding-like beta-propeller repeat protein [Bacillota bacterium]
MKSNTAYKKPIKTFLSTLLITSIVLTLFALPSPNNTANAQGYNYTNPANIALSCNPTGVNQTVLVTFFLVNPPPQAAPGYDPTRNWNGFEVTVTSPSNKIEKFGPYTSDASGGYFFYYTPKEVGNYTLFFTFPGQKYGNNYFTPQNATTTLIVQQDPIKPYQTPPLPTGYWERPIYGENRGWYKIGGNWLQNFYNNTVKFNPYTTAPNTAHVVWKKQQYMGGIVGGGNYLDSSDQDLTYYQGPIYQNYFVPPIIIGGKVYYLIRSSAGNAFTGMSCVDIRTGNELWFKDASEIGSTNTFYGQIFSPNGVNGAGSFPYLWNTGGTTWRVFDANTGDKLYSIANVTTSGGTISGPQILSGGLDPMNSIIAYYIDGTNNWLLKWNSTKMLETYAGAGAANIYSAPYGQTIDWRRGIQWNVTIPHSGKGIYSFGISGSPGSNNGITPSDGKVIFAATATITSQAINNFTMVAYSCDTGEELWTNDFSDVFLPGTTLFEFFGTVYDGVMVLYQRNTREWYGYDEMTGKRLWGPTEPLPAAWDTFTAANCGYGKLFVSTYAGNVYCYDIKNGTRLWSYSVPSSGINTPYGGYPLLAGTTIADGKVYIATGEHTPNSPQWLGAAMYCVNATTGDFIYKMGGWWSSSPFIADGYLLSEDTYSGDIYCFGKGKTAVTASAPDTAISLGQEIVIKGTVTDKSPGAIDYAGNKLNTEGTPAIADEYMTEWMAYLYQQKPKPINATGVTVTLDVIDANGNYRNIGTTTSDMSGFYSFVWQPDIPGKYTLIASFAGSESYFGASTETAFTVSEAPESTPSPTAQPTSMADAYFLPMVIGMITGFVIISVLLVLLLLRKRP